MPPVRQCGCWSFGFGFGAGVCPLDFRFVTLYIHAHGLRRSKPGTVIAGTGSRSRIGALYFRQYALISVPLPGEAFTPGCYTIAAIRGSGVQVCQFRPVPARFGYRAAVDPLAAILPVVVVLVNYDGVVVEIAIPPIVAVSGIKAVAITRAVRIGWVVGRWPAPVPSAVVIIIVVIIEDSVDQLFNRISTSFLLMIPFVLHLLFSGDHESISNGKEHIVNSIIIHDHIAVIYQCFGFFI